MSRNGDFAEEILRAKEAAQHSLVRETVRASLERSLAEKREQRAALQRLQAQKAAAALKEIQKAIEEHQAETRRVILDLHDRKTAAKRTRETAEQTAEAMKRNREAQAAAAEAAAEEARKERQAEMEAEAEVLARAFAKHAAAPGTVVLGEGAVKVSITETSGEEYELDPDE